MSAAVCCSVVDEDERSFAIAINSFAMYLFGQFYTPTHICHCVGLYSNNNNNKYWRLSSTSLNFISEPGRRICVHTGDARETS